MLFVVGTMQHIEISSRDVRRLLRKLRSPSALERDAIAAKIRQALRRGSAHDAVLELVDDVLRHAPPIYRRILTRVDIEGAPASEVAAELDLSYRTLHRYRSTVVAAVADLLQRRLGARAP